MLTQRNVGCYENRLIVKKRQANGEKRNWKILQFRRFLGKIPWHF